MPPDDRPEPAAPRAPGRPRLYQPDAERTRILGAAMEVLRRNDGEEATVAEILRQAGLSTRAFYRHFQTKEDVVQALYQRDAESFGSHLRRRVEAAADPEAALAAWVEALLGLGYDRRRAERVAALRSPMVLRVVTGTAAEQLGRELLVAPLRAVLEEGRRTGDFPGTRPDLDVHAIRALAWEAVDWAGGERVRLSQDDARDYVVRFSRAALGARP